MVSKKGALMNFTKTYIWIFPAIMLFFFTQSLEAMKKIENHALKIEKISTTQGLETLFSSINVSMEPFLEGNSCAQLLDAETLAFINMSGNIQIYSLKTGTILKTLEDKDATIMRILKVDKNIIISGANDGSIKVWSITKTAGNECIKTISYGKRSIHCITNFTENIFAYCTNNGIIRIFDWKNTKEIKVNHIKMGIDCFMGIESMGKENILFWNSLGHIAIFNAKDTKNIKYIEIACGISKVKKIADETYIFGYCDGSAIVYNFNNNEKHKICSNHNHGFSYTLDEFFQKRVIDFLQIPGIDSIVCSTPKIITFLNTDLNTKTLQCTHQIDCSTFLKKTDDNISSLFYVKEGNKIIAITKKGLIITCQDNSKTAKKDNDFPCMDNLCNKFEKAGING